MQQAAQPEPITGALQRLQSLLLSVENIAEFLQELAEVAAGVVDPPASCGITAQRDGQPITVASSDELARILDEGQYDTGGGPCLHAMHTGHPTYIADVSAERRWSGYMSIAREHGLQSSLSLPLAAHGGTVGAMNMYAFHTTDAFDADEQQRCTIFAAQAAGALQLATRNHRHTELLEQLERALTSRTVIDQALGILMSERRCSAAEAFAVLRTESQNSQRKLRLVATELIERTTGQPIDNGKPFRAE